MAVFFSQIKTQQNGHEDKYRVKILSTNSSLCDNITELFSFFLRCIKESEKITILKLNLRHTDRRI